MEEQLDKAKKVLSATYELLKNKGDFSRYQTSCVNMLISLTSLLYHEKNYEDLFDYSKKLLSFQKQYNKYNRIYYGEFYLSVAYYQKKQFAESKIHFMRALYSMSLFGNKVDISLIKNMKLFDEIAEYFSIDSDDIILY